MALLDDAFGAFTLEEIGAALDGGDIIWAPVLTAAEAAVDAQAIAAGCVVETPSPSGGVFKAPAAPIRFPGANDGPKGPVPSVGQHTRDVLSEIGYGGAEIDALFASGAAA